MNEEELALESISRFGLSIMPKKKKKDTYNEENIKVLGNIEAVRKRPHMYIGDTSHDGIHHLVTEVVDNAVDEFMRGAADEINVYLYDRNTVKVRDNGSGIPVGNHDGTNKPAVEVVFTRLHAGAKFDDKLYKASGGLHGVGVTAVNALSKRLVAIVKRDGYVHRIEFSRGETTKPLKRGEKTKETGTTVIFQPDPEIFKRTDDFDGKLDPEVIKKRLQQLAYLNPGLKLTFTNVIDGEVEEEAEYYSKNGLLDYLSALFDERDCNQQLSKPIFLEGEVDKVRVSVAVQYTSTENVFPPEEVISYCNSIHTEEGGTHVTGFRRAWTNVLSKSYAEENADQKKRRKRKSDVIPEDFRAGMVAIVSVKVPNPQFKAQTKGKLLNTEAEKAVYQCLAQKLSDFLEENPQIRRKIFLIAKNAAEMRAAVRAVKDQKKSNNLGNVAKCYGKSRDKNELFLVEGESAGGSATRARDASFQAILPIKGKILNVEKATIKRIITNDEIVSIINNIGTGIASDYDDRARRYDKVIILTDADVDGSHIRILLLTFFFRQMPQLINDGHLYCVNPPLYRYVSGRERRYIYSRKQRLTELCRAAYRNGLRVFSGSGKRKPLPEAFLKHAVGLYAATYRIRDFFRGARVSAQRFFDRRKGEVFPKYLVFGGEKVQAFRTRKAAKKFRASMGGDILDISDFSVDVERRLMKMAEKLGWSVDQLLEHEFVVRSSRRKHPQTATGVFDVVKTFEKEGEAYVKVTRFKGLGEMDPDELAHTTMDPAHRSLVRITIEDAARANKIVTDLMGKVNVRKEYLTRSAPLAELDI